MPEYQPPQSFTYSIAQFTFPIPVRQHEGYVNPLPTYAIREDSYRLQDAEQVLEEEERSRSDDISRGGHFIFIL